MKDIDINMPYEKVDDEYFKRLVELWNETHNLEYSTKLIGCIESKKIRNLNLENFNRELLFIELNDKKTLLQHLIEGLLDNKIDLNYKTVMFFASDMQIVLEFLKNKCSRLEYSIKEDLLFSECEPGMLLIDYMFINNLVNSEIISKVQKNDSIVSKILLYKKELLSDLNETFLFDVKIGEDRVIDYMFKNNLVTKDTMDNIVDAPEIIDLINKYGKQELLSYATDSLMKRKYKDQLILDYLLDNNIKIESYIYSDDNIERLLERKVYYVLANLTEYSLLKKTSSGITILESLLKDGVTPKDSYFFQEESLGIFIKYGEYKRACKYTFNTLMKKANLNETYLEQLIKAHVRGENVPFASILPYSDDKDILADFYLLFAKYNIMEYVSDLDEKDLLSDKGSGCLLEALLKKDVDLTLDRIISKRTKEKFDVAMYLKLNGFIQDDIKMDLHSTQILDDYNDRFNSSFDKLAVSEEDEKLLEELKTLMNADGQSDKQLVDALITSYRYQLYSRNVLGRRELYKLIEMKSKGRPFYIRRSKEGSYYSEGYDSVYLENINLNTLNHEMGHALYHMLTDKEVPRDYKYMVEQLKADKEVLRKVKEYSLTFKEMRDRVRRVVDDIYMKEYDESIDGLEKEDIMKFLKANREEKMKFYLQKGYSEETLNAVFDSVFSLDEYLIQDRRIKKEELVDSIMRSEYGSFITIGDILDAIYSGKFKSHELRDEHGAPIDPGYGHGISYYSRGIGWSFDETMANFSAIVKSPDVNTIMTYLRNIVGERYINLISRYYEKEITLSTKQIEEVKAAGQAIA